MATSYMTASELSQAYESVLKPSNKPEHEISQVTSTDDKYEVKLSIHNFEPDELSVKVIDRYVHVEGRHEEKNDKIGFFTRQFTRRYFLPDGAQPESIRCTYSLDTNILTVTAPIVNKKPVKEIVIPIVIIGQQHHPQPKPREPRDPSHHRGGEKERERGGGEREQNRDRQKQRDKDRDREREQQQQHHHHHHHHPLHQQHLYQQQQHTTSASVTATSSSTTGSSSRKHHHKQQQQQQQNSSHHQQHRNHHHNHHNEPHYDKYQHQMNF